jgi:hypothetical protein
MAPSLAQMFESSRDFRFYSWLRNPVRTFDNAPIVGLSENTAGPRLHTLSVQRL